MIRTMCMSSVRSFGMLLVCYLGAWPGVSGADEGTPQSPIEVDNWSIWVGSPSQTSVNALRTYRNAMPGAVGTSRPKVEDKELSTTFPVAPISIIQFFGEPTQDVDVELRVKKGTLLAHWPPSKEQGGRLQWFKSSLSTAAPADIPPAYLPESHWFQGLRNTRPALFLKNESRAERFIAYDAELTIPIPLKIRGGPDEFTLQNLTGSPLRDIAVIAPTDAGYRVGWLDELPTAAPDKDQRAEKKQDAAKKSDREKAETLLEEVGKGSQDEGEKVRPLPAEGDATIRAQVDQVLNRPVTVNAEQVGLKDVLNLIAGQARLRIELDDQTLVKAKNELNQPTSMKAVGVAARDALSEILGNAGLSFRVTETGTLFVTTSARLAEETGKQGVVIEGPPIKLILSQPLKPSNPSYRELTHDAYARRLAGQGLREEVVELILGHYGQALFEPRELIVLAHLSTEAIDDAVLLDVFPPPKKQVRTALLVMHGVDPRLQDRARTLVQQLGDKSPGVRESAEAQLFELGAVAVPALEDAPISKDVEIIFRAERLLLRLNRPVP